MQFVNLILIFDFKQLDGNRIFDPIEIKIEGLSSLKYLRLELFSVKQMTFRNLTGMRELDLFLLYNSPNNLAVLSKFSSELSECFPNIEKLTLHGFCLNLNLDNLINLKDIKLFFILIDDFNFDIFKYICNQLERIVLICHNLNDNFLAKLFYPHNFPYLRELDLSNTKISKFEKKFFDRFPMLQTLSVYENRELRKIDHDAFSNLKHLVDLQIKYCRIESIEKSYFSSLANLEILVLDGNPLREVKEYVFSDLKNLHILSLNNIQLTSLGPKSLAGLNNLEFLSLKDNKLTDFDFSILDNIWRIREIDLSGNPIINKDITFYPLTNGEKVLFKYT